MPFCPVPVFAYPFVRTCFRVVCKSLLTDQGPLGPIILMNDKIFQRYHVVTTPIPLPHVSVLRIIIVPSPLSANPFCVPTVVPNPPILWLQTSKVVLQVTIRMHWNCPCCCSTLPFLLYISQRELAQHTRSDHICFIL